jgi:hypothetical protein
VFGSCDPQVIEHLNHQWITAAIAQKFSAVETAANFFKRRLEMPRPQT